MNNFTMLGHWTGDEFKYELQIEEEDKVMMFPFKTAKQPQKVKTLAEAQSIECPCKQMGNVEGISRLYGEFSEPTERVKQFLNFEGVTKDGQVYKVLEKGKVEIVKTEMGTTLNFESELIDGRWLLRTLPNIFNKEFIEGSNMQLLWKPGPEKITTEASEFSTQIMKIESHMTSQILDIDETKSEFNTVVAAEGRWTDRFGNNFIYTKDFLQTLFTSMQESLKKGKLGVDMSHNKKDNGKMTSLQLLDEPYAHIVGRGFYDGSISNTNGVSIDAEFDVFFDPKANAYIPVSGVTKRVSLVASPACKVCKFIPK